MVITMMGVNDPIIRNDRLDSELLGSYNENPIGQLGMSLKRLKILKLIDWLWNTYKYKQIADSFTISVIEEDIVVPLVKQNDSIKKSEKYVGLGKSYEDKFNYSEAEKMFLNAIKLSPKEISFYLSLGDFYHRTYLNTNFKDREKYGKKSKEILLKIIKWDSSIIEAYSLLAEEYCFDNKLEEAKKLFEKYIRLFPDKFDGYTSAANVYNLPVCNMVDEAERMYLKTINKFPKVSDKTYYSLGLLHYNKNKLKKAKEFFKKSIEINPFNEKAYSYLGHIFRKQDKRREAEEMFNKAGKIRMSVYSIKTRDKYRELSDILYKRGKVYIAMQYPTRSVNEIKRYFDEDDNVIFVSNEKNFKKALKTKDYEYYFGDTFAGDFGHCTTEGNRLIAENVAGVVLKELDIS